MIQTLRPEAQPQTQEYHDWAASMHKPNLARRHQFLVIPSSALHNCPCSEGQAKHPNTGINIGLSTSLHSLRCRHCPYFFPSLIHPIHCLRPCIRKAGYHSKSSLFFPAYISNKPSKSVGIPSHATLPNPAPEPTSTGLTCRTRFGRHTVSDPRISPGPTSANNTLPSPGSSNTPTRTVVVNSNPK
jgi:hypothetical protein